MHLLLWLLLAAGIALAWLALRLFIALVTRD